MARDGLLPPWAAKIHPKYRTPHITTLLTGLFVASWALIGDAGETYDLTNIGTLFAFAIVCAGVLILRRIDPNRERPFRVPFAWAVCIGGAGACLFVMKGLPRDAWSIRRLAGDRAGTVFAYGFKHSKLRQTTDQMTSTRGIPCIG